MIPTLPTLRVGWGRDDANEGVVEYLKGMEGDVKFKINGNILTITGIE